MGQLRRLVVDVLKPHEPSLMAFTEQVAGVETVAGITSSLIERDEEVQNVKLTIEGENVDYEALEDAVERLGGTVHSVDQASYGEFVVEDRATHQDG